MNYREKINKIYDDCFGGTQLNIEIIMEHIPFFISSVSTYKIGVRDFAELFVEIKGIRNYELSDRLIDDDNMITCVKMSDDSIMAFASVEYDLNSIKKLFSSEKLLEIVLVYSRTADDLIKKYCLNRLIMDCDSLLYNPDVYREIEEMFR